MTMKYAVYIYKNDNHINLILRDNTKMLGQAGSIMLRDQSSYEEDCGKLVWKNAAHPSACWFKMLECKGFPLAESNIFQLLDPNIKWNALNYIWNERIGAPL